MDNLHPFFSFILVLVSIGACIYVIVLGNNLIESSAAKSSEDKGEVEVESDGSKIKISLKSSSGVVLIVLGLGGILTILYLYWMYALPLLLFGGGGYTANRYKQMHM